MPSQEAVDVQEKKRERFVRIAEHRVNKVLNDLDLLSKCSNRRNYKYDDRDVKKIFSELERKVREIKAMFQDSDNNKKAFRLQK